MNIFINKCDRFGQDQIANLWYWGLFPTKMIELIKTFKNRNENHICLCFDVAV